MKQFVILDERDIWWRPALKAAVEFGYNGRRIMHGRDMPDGALGFIRPHADPVRLVRNRSIDYLDMCLRGPVLQDALQVACYENKTLQFERWARWMPATWVFYSRDLAHAFADSMPALPLVSKANEGASSVNVRIIESPEALRRHIDDVFDGRVAVNPCSGFNRPFKQHGYIYLQQHIPHTVTWRVNAIGNARAIFKRYNYPDRPVAQTGNVEPVKSLSAFTDRLLEWCDVVFDDIGTRWCALDVLETEGDFRLLETSLAWPWPSPGDCNSAPLFRSRYMWIDIWRCMFSEYAEGAWAKLM